MLLLVDDNRVETQPEELVSRFCYSDVEGRMNVKDYCVKLVFDIEGNPDSTTALFLDSLLIGWSGYIPFYCIDTVLIIPVADVRDLFMDGDELPAETF